MSKNIWRTWNNLAMYRTSIFECACIHTYMPIYQCMYLWIYYEKCVGNLKKYVDVIQLFKDKKVFGFLYSDYLISTTFNLFFIRNQTRIFNNHIFSQTMHNARNTSSLTQKHATKYDIGYVYVCEYMSPCIWGYLPVWKCVVSMRGCDCVCLHFRFWAFCGRICV